MSAGDDDHHIRRRGDIGDVYALVDDSSLSQSPSPWSSTVVSLPNSSRGMTSSVEQWYDHYAKIYPSTNYLERQRRRVICMADKKALSSRRMELEAAGGGGGSSWFRRLIYWTSGTSILTSSSTLQPSGREAAAIGTDGDKYGYEGDEEDEEEDDSEFGNDDNWDKTALLSPSSQTVILDESVVPREATSFHRFHLASERRAISLSDAIALPVRPLVGSSAAVTHCIVGYGQIAEFRTTIMDDDDDDGNACNNATRISLTSDWQSMTIMSTPTTDLSTPQLRDLRHARAASIGPDCLAVSWGRRIVVDANVDHNDNIGRIVFYRRTMRCRGNECKEHIGWKAVAVAYPSEAVVGAAMESVTTPHEVHYNDDEEEETRRVSLLSDAGLLTVTDLLSIPTNNNEDVMLAISRLGGFVELLPLPRWIWQPLRQNDDIYSNPDDDDDESMTSPTVRDLPNLTDSSKITAFTMTQHHFDVMSLDAFQCPDTLTTVVREGPTANVDCILATCGGGRSHRLAASPTNGTTVKQNNNPEVVTLWAVSHSIGEIDLDVSLASTINLQVIPFEIIVRRLDHYQIKNVGPDSSTFLVDAEPWTVGDGYDYGQPSQMKRKRKRKTSNNEEQKQRPPAFIAIVTTTVPITSLRFTPPGSNDKVLLATLDYNGGVSVLDCTELIRMATSRGQNNESNNTSPCIRNGDSEVRISLVCGRDSTMIIPSESRKRSKSSSKRGIIMARATQIEWWTAPYKQDSHEHSSTGEESFCSSFTLVTYATLSESRNSPKSRVNATILRLQRWSWSSDIAKGHDQRHPSDIFRMPMHSSDSNTSSIALLPMLVLPQEHHQTLSFLRLSVDALHLASSSKTIPPPRCCPQLSICGIRKLSNHVEIIAILLRQGDVSKAIGVARRLGIDDNGEHFYLGEEGRLMMNQCRIRLWEDKGDVKALKVIFDDAYVIDQAVKLLQSCDVNKDLTLDDLSEAFREALTRCDALLGNESTARQFKDTITRIGTYKLLLNYYGGGHTASNLDADATAGFSLDRRLSVVRRFLNDFNSESLRRITASAALRGDCNALTVLIVRHPFSISTRMELLDLIPLEVDLSLYEHLLPCNVGLVDDHNFLLRSSEKFLSPLQLFTHFSNLQLQRRQEDNSNSRETNLAGVPPIDIFTDYADRDHVMLHLEEGSGDTATLITKDDVATWYLKRALNTHNRYGQVISLQGFCEAGLVRLGSLAFTVDGENTISDLTSGTESRAVGKLLYLYSAASFFSRILTDKMSSIICEPLSNERFGDLMSGGGIFLSVIQFCCMDLNDTISYVHDFSNVHNMSMFEKYFAQFFDGSECFEPNNITATTFAVSDDMPVRLLHIMMEFCVKKIERLLTSMNIKSSTLQQTLSLTLEESLTLCADLALLCRSYSKSYIAHDEVNLVDFSDRVFNTTLDVIDGALDLLTLGVIDKLWSIFELLPQTTSRESDDQTSAISKIYIDGLHFRLVALQLCCKWRGGAQQLSRKLWTFFSHTSLENNSKCTKDLCLAGLDVISIMCNGFCDIVTHTAILNDNSRTPHQDIDLLVDFISDVDEFDIRFFSSGAQQSGCIGNLLLSPLLYHRCFDVLNNIFKLRPSWFCGKYTSSFIASFIRDIAIQDDNADIMLSCQEVIVKISPQLCSEYEHQQRMIAVKTFLANDMSLDRALLATLFNIVDHLVNPIELVRAIIEIDAQVILMGCEFWGDVSAIAACTDASTYFSSRIRALLNGISEEECINELPPMPGALVMQLAHIIGLYTPSDILLVKRYMISGALTMNLVPAAVAICFSMICDIAVTMQGISADFICSQSLVLDCVVAIAKAESFADVTIKRELCTLTLMLFSSTSSSLYYQLLDKFKDLEYVLLASKINFINDDATQLDESAYDLLVFKAAGLVAKGARDLLDKSSGSMLKTPISNYGGIGNSFYDHSMNRIFHEINALSHVDVLQLFHSINERANNLAHVSIKAIFQWIVFEAFKARNSSFLLSLPTTNIFMMTEFGLSCLLEFQGHGLVMKSTKEDFKAAQSRLPITQIGSPESVAKLDESIIRRLSDRGYGRNAARRAVMMTGNQGYSAALSWAVSHFSDDDFDSPIYFLHSDEPHIDQHLVDMTDKLLQAVQNHERANSQTGGLHSFRNDTTKKSTSTKRPNSSSRKHMATKLSCLPSPLTSPLKEDRLSPRGNTGQTNDILPKTTTVLKPPIPSTSQLSPPQEAVKNNPSMTNVEETPIVTAVLPTESPESISSVGEGSLNSHVEVANRIQVARNETQKLDPEERKRLALEGKRLLLAARAQRQNVLAPPSSIVTTSRSK